MLSVSVGELPSWIELAARSKNNVLIVGDPGVGKSQVIGGMENENCKVTMMTGSSTIEEYVNGIPTPDEMKFTEKDKIRVLKYIAPQWLADMLKWQQEHPDGRQVLFLDEFNTADPQVLKTFLTILTERRIPTLGISLPESTVIVAAMNPQDQNEGEPLIRPMASRFMTLKISSTMDTYKAFLKGETPTVSGDLPECEDQPRALDDATKVAFVDEVATKEWQSFDEANGHEINPRSFSNFFRALEWVKNRNKFSPNLSQAFLGIRLTFPALKAGSTTSGSPASAVPYLDRAQLEALTDDELEAYFRDISKPSITGQAAIRSRAACRNVMRDRGLATR